jgi:hypothetical protein
MKEDETAVAYSTCGQTFGGITPKDLLEEPGVDGEYDNGSERNRLRGCGLD